MFVPISGGSSSGYTIGNSVRFRSAASAYLSRTFGTPTNNKIYTLSLWCKWSNLSATLPTLFAPTGGGFFAIGDATNPGVIRFNDGSGCDLLASTSVIFRDPAAHYHFVIAVDTTQATAANRVKIYVNAVQLTSFASATYMSQNASQTFNSAVAHNIGRRADATNYFDGYLSEIYFVDGQALTPSSFGATDATTGQWRPKAYAGTYGTNGFYLKFNDGSNLTNLCLDRSGNGTNWTANNISLTAGVTYDWMSDTPTNNYCVLSPISGGSASAIVSGNLKNYSSGASFLNAVGSFALSSTSPKTYWEGAIETLTGASNATFFGLIKAANISAGRMENIAATAGLWCGATDQGYSAGSNTFAVGGTTAAGTVVQVAYDPATGKLWLGKANVWFNSSGGTTGDPAAGTNPTFTLSTSVEWSPVSHAYADGIDFNFGQRPFAYTPPTGYVALCTSNMPTPAIPKPSAHMNAVLYAGDGTASHAVTGAGHQPDLVWIKNRGSAQSHALINSVCGNSKDLASDSVNAEATGNIFLGAPNPFGADGFNLVSNGARVNAASNNYVAWTWKASGSTVSNTAGSITSTVSANTVAGFSIVTYTGNGTNGATVGHGLGVVPSLIIEKDRSAGTYNWSVQGCGRLWTPATSGLFLNTTSALNPSQIAAGPTSSVFTPSNTAYANVNGNLNVAYCFAEIEGYSKAFSYVGNSSSDGTFVYLGFSARWIIFKNITNSAQWMMFDTARNTYNVISNGELLANSTSAEGSGGWGNEIDIVSNGIKFRGSDANNFNITGNTYVGFAIAEQPFKYANAR